MAKFHFAHGFHDAVRTVIDLAGGLLITGPRGSFARRSASMETPATRSL
jgi:hypothetical protein